MPAVSVPKTRPVISKDAALTTERIPQKTENKTVLGRIASKREVVKLLKQAPYKKRRLTRSEKEKKRNLPPKFLKPKGSSFHFRTLESFVKKGQSHLKHQERLVTRRKNPAVLAALKKQLSNVPVLMIVRIHNPKNIPKTIQTQLNNLFLVHPFQCVLCRTTPQLIKQLVDVQAFVTFGIPTPELIRELVTKRGKLLDATQTKRVLITSNVMVEKVLGQHDCICIEDIVQVLQSNPYVSADDKDSGSTSTSTPLRITDTFLKSIASSPKVQQFDAVCHAINPFQLNTLKIPIRGLQTPFNRKGYWGYRGKHITKFVEKLI